jgi:molecular chaperone DnaK
MGNVVGIDLGTTYSAISRINQYGAPEIVTVGDQNERMIASILYFGSDKTTYVGKPAVDRLKLEKDQSKLVKLVKRFMGEDYYPSEIEGKKWTPSELSGILLAKMKEDFENQYGKIDKCIITVPAYFDEKRRQATMQAGQLAGLPVIGIVNEPTAAALLYAKEFKVKGTSLVFDLGGGTFDVTILKINYPNIEILSSEGDRDLGGARFDESIKKFGEAKLGKQFWMKNNQADEKDFHEYMTDRESEELKKVLSSKEKASGVGNYGVDFSISREEFEKSIKSYFAKIELLIETAIEEAKIDYEEVENIILVGGSSRIPLVNTLIKKMFGKEPIKMGNMDEAVALGASLYCGLKVAADSSSSSLLSARAREDLGKVKLFEIANFPLSTASLEYNEQIQDNKDTTQVIIPKGEKLPCKKTQTFYTSVANQTKIRFRVIQGDLPEPTDNVLIYEGEFEIPSGRPQGQPIDITFEYDSNGLMKCTCKDVKSGKELVVDLDMSKDVVKQDSDDFAAKLDF